MAVMGGAPNAVRRGTAVALYLTVVSVVANACYAPNVDTCAIRCSQSKQCPSGLTCNAAQVCVGPNQACESDPPLMDARAIDAAIDSATEPTQRCVGTASACSTFRVGSQCATQQGCRFTPLSCENTFSCANQVRNCHNIPNCRPFIENGTLFCIRRDNFCSGSTQNQCEGVQGCTFNGGCAGTAAACQTFASEATCRAQGGCVWQ